MELKDKVVIITGPKGGLGTSVTHAFLDAGAMVAGVSRSIRDADFPVEHFAAMPSELASIEETVKLVEAVRARFGRIDGLVHLVGGYAGGRSVAESDEALLDKMLEMNLRTAFRAIRAVLPVLRAQGRGRILAIGSKAAVEPSPTVAAYAASKAALVSLIRTVARENVDRHITANILLPGTMDTPGNRAGVPTADSSKWVRPSEVASLLVHLMSDSASQVSGAVIPVYGEEA